MSSAVCPNCNENAVQHGLDSAYCLNCGVKLNYGENGILEADVDVTVAAAPAPADTSLATPTATPVYAQDWVGNRVEDTNQEPVPTDTPGGPAPDPGDAVTLEDTEAIPSVPSPAEQDAGLAVPAAAPVEEPQGAGAPAEESSAASQGAPVSQPVQEPPTDSSASATDPVPAPDPVSEPTTGEV